jgi:hypothetical protein
MVIGQLSLRCLKISALVKLVSWNTSKPVMSRKLQVTNNPHNLFLFSYVFPTTSSFFYFYVSHIFLISVYRNVEGYSSEEVFHSDDKSLELEISL